MGAGASTDRASRASVRERWGSPAKQRYSLDKDRKPAAFGSGKIAAAAAVDASAPTDPPVTSESQEASRWTVSKWLSSLPLHPLLCDALGATDAAHRRADMYQYVRGLSKEDVRRHLQDSSDKIIEGLIEQLWESVLKLREQRASSAEELNMKFAKDATHTVSWGSASVFHGGLEGLIGIPLMMRGSDGERSLAATLAFEHTQKADSELDFSTANGCTSCSCVEYEFVCTPTTGDPYPERAGLDPSLHRKALPPSAFAAQLATRNEILRGIGSAEVLERSPAALSTRPCVVAHA